MCIWLQKQSFQSPPFLPPLGASGESLGPSLSNGMILVQIYPSGSLKTFHSPLYRVMSSLWHPQTMCDLCTPPGDSQMAPPALCPVWRFTIREGMQKVNASLLLQRRSQQVKILIHLPVAHLWHNFRYIKNKAPRGNLVVSEKWHCSRSLALMRTVGQRSTWQWRAAASWVWHWFWRRGHMPGTCSRPLPPLGRKKNVMDPSHEPRYPGEEDSSHCSRHQENV